MKTTEVAKIKKPQCNNITLLQIQIMLAKL